MTTKKIAYSGNVAITMDLSALGASATFIAGRESNEIDNTGDLYLDALVRGKFLVGTTPTLPCQFNVYAWGYHTSIAGPLLDSLDGVDSAETITNTTHLTNMLRLAAACPILVNTSDLGYHVAPFSVAQLFDGIMPKFWGLFVAHNMTAALKTDAGNTNSFSFNGITSTDT